MENCLFCKIVNKEIKSQIIYENDYVISFLDINPISDGHCLVIPKKHFDNLLETEEKYLQEIALAMKVVGNKIFNSKLKPWGFNYISNQNKIAGQEIFHYHFHIIPKYFPSEGLILSTKKINLKNVEEIYKQIINS